MSRQTLNHDQIPTSILLGTCTTHVQDNSRYTGKATYWPVDGLTHACYNFIYICHSEKSVDWFIDTIMPISENVFTNLTHMIMAVNA